MAGPWEKYGGRAPAAPVTLGSPDPYKARENSRQDEELNIRRQTEARMAQAALLEAEVKRIAAEKTIVETDILRKKYQDPAAKEREVIGLRAAAKKAETERTKRAAAMQILNQLGPLEQEYNANFRGAAGSGNTPGPMSLLEYLPRKANARFDQGSGLLSQLLKGVIRTPGEGAWTDKDQEYLNRISPGSWRADAANETAFKDIRRLLEPYAPPQPKAGRKATVKRVR